MSVHTQESYVPGARSLQLVDAPAQIGLGKTVKRYELLALVKRVGRLAGFTPRMIQLLDYYMSYTKEIDWTEGETPIVYQALSRTALDLGVSERQIQHLEKDLARVGAITWQDSGNHRRFGQRDKKTSRILYAYGVDLSPLADLQEQLVLIEQNKKLYDDAWMETKRQISYYRSQIRQIAEFDDRGDFSARYEELAKPIRSYMKLPQLRELLDAHKLLFSDMKSNLTMSQNTSSTDEAELQPHTDTTHKSFDKSNYSSTDVPCLQEDVANSIGVTSGKGRGADESGAGQEHLSLNQLVSIAEEGLSAHFSIYTEKMNWSDFINAAYAYRARIHISQNSWGLACETLGRIGAAICVLLTDRAMNRAEDPVRNPAAYFNGMVNKARAGELYLQRSVFAAINLS